MSIPARTLFPRVDLGGTNFTVGLDEANGAEDEQPTISHHQSPATV